MVKKVILLIVVLGLVGGGFFYWWQDQADVRALNKTLPEGIKVQKSLFGREYKVVNHIDGYEFKIPPEWEGVKEIAYRDVTGDQDFGFYSSMDNNLKRKIDSETILNVDGNETISSLISIRLFYLNEGIALNSFVEEFKNTFLPYQKIETKNSWMEIIPSIEIKKMGKYDIFKLMRATRSSSGHDSLPLAEAYFFKNNHHIYMIDNGGWGDDIVEKIVLNGKW